MAQAKVKAFLIFAGFEKPDQQTLNVVAHLAALPSPDFFEVVGYMSLLPDVSVAVEYDDTSEQVQQRLADEAKARIVTFVAGATTISVDDVVVVFMGSPGRY
jgi:hypothetical protein